MSIHISGHCDKSLNIIKRYTSIKDQLSDFEFGQFDIFSLYIIKRLFNVVK